jgi:hypothetical protein
VAWIESFVAAAIGMWWRVIRWRAGLNGSLLEDNTRSYDRMCLSEFYRRKYAQLLGITEIAQNIPNGISDADSKVAV